MNHRKYGFVLSTVWALSTLASAGDRPQWGERFTRNMISDETGLVSTFDPASGTNVKWTAPLGGNAYGTPTVSGGRVYVGANNSKPRDPRIEGDYGVLLCLNEGDGGLVWQLPTPRTGGDDYLDWPMIAICSPPTVEGDRVYAVTNRFEVVCLDVKGQSNGNDGPYQDEGKHMAQNGAAPFEVTSADADIIWLIDLPKDVEIWPHDGAHASILLDGPFLYLNSGNGVDNTHKVIRKPDAPSLIVLDKATGRVVAKDDERIGPRIFHGTWCSPAMGELGGQKQVIFGGGDGVCYGFEALRTDRVPQATEPLKRIWRYDGDPMSPKENVAQYLKNTEVSPSTISGMPVFHKNRVYLSLGGDIWWGKKKSWIKCYDIASEKEIWSFEMAGFCCATPAISDGLLYAADCNGLLHCLDAETGQECWSHDLGRDVWGSALVADGKVYVGTRGRDLWILPAGRAKGEPFSARLDAPIATTPVAANGVVYVASQQTLYALAQTAKP